MPCNCDYLNASSIEIELSKVACLLGELDGIPIDKNYWRGYHPAVYNQQDINGNAMVQSLCEKLQNVDITKYSLEMQMWWRDHQAADKARLELQLSVMNDNKEKEAALKKLTPHERKLLGV